MTAHRLPDELPDAPTDEPTDGGPEDFAFDDEARRAIDEPASDTSQASEWGADGEDAFVQGDYELEERHALRRVAGLSTELADISEVEYRQLRLERVVLVGVWTEGTQTDADRSLAELAALAETAGSQVLEAVSQRRGQPGAPADRGSREAIP